MRTGEFVQAAQSSFQESLVDEEYIEGPMYDGDDGTGPQPTGDEEENLDEEEDGKGDGNPVPPEKE